MNPIDQYKSGKMTKKKLLAKAKANPKLMSQLIKLMGEPLDEAQLEELSGSGFHTSMDALRKEAAAHGIDVDAFIEQRDLAFDPGGYMFTNEYLSTVTSLEHGGWGCATDYEAKGGDDVVMGTYDDDIIDGGDGDDILFGDHGNDTLMGGDGADILFGGAGDDVMSGGENITGTYAEDKGFGGEGNDTWLWTSRGENEGEMFCGGSGHDTISLELENLTGTVQDAFNRGELVIHCVDESGQQVEITQDMFDEQGNLHLPEGGAGLMFWEDNPRGRIIFHGVEEISK